MKDERYEIKFDNRIERVFEHVDIRVLLKIQMEIKHGINLGRLSFSLNCHIVYKR